VDGVPIITKSKFPISPETDIRNLRVNGAVLSIVDFALDARSCHGIHHQGNFCLRAIREWDNFVPKDKARLRVLRVRSMSQEMIVGFDLLVWEFDGCFIQH
jgi:hypothetical protein